ncbi:MAG: hypothetical protein M1814_006705 [Vezdaea aestivalis]|nr:MAG: hypothetical protein M1814_006705 [Vezdaea aestivalis]
MTTKLDQSLEDVITTGRKMSSRRGGRRVGKGTQSRTAVPVGGIAKGSRAAKATAKTATPLGPTRKGEGKVIVSNLPHDVEEGQIKDYFAQTIAPVKRVQLTYGPNGQSRGVATVVFFANDSASKAMTAMNGVKVDGKSIKVELVLDAKSAPAPAPIKGLRDRVTAPKATPKSASEKPKSAAKDGSRGRRRGGRGAAGARRKPKTAEELDVEMDDYFGGPNETADGTTNGVAATASGDVGMEGVM